MQTNVARTTREDQAPTGVPIDDPRLEAIAHKIFAVTFPRYAWGDPAFYTERDTCRRFAIQLRLDYLKLDALTPSNAAERLSDEFSTLVFGERCLGPTIRSEIASFAECTVSDLWITFRNRLFYAKDVEANNMEVEQERNDGRA